MKKLYFYGMAACLAFAFASCDGYEEPNPPAQFNPQESIIQTDDVVVSNLLTEETYSLAELNDQDQNITVAQIECSILPAGYEFGSVLYISGNDFKTQFEVPSTVEAAEEAGVYKIVVNPDDLQGIYAANISRSPKAKDIQVRFLVTTVYGTQVGYVGGIQNYYGSYTMNVLPMPSDFVIEEAYYLLGTINGWDVATAVKFNHSDVDQYDDPIFTLQVEITDDQVADGWWWKIIPESTFVTGDWSDADYSQYGVAENGDDAAEGMLKPKLNGADPGAGCFKQAGSWVITINMEEGTYSFSPGTSYLWTPGEATGWDVGASQQLFGNEADGFKGFARLSPGGFKFTSQPDWLGTNYGFVEEATKEDNGFWNGVLTNDGGAGNLTVPELGLYYCNVHPAALTYQVYQVTTIGMIGNATPNGWDASTALTPSEDMLTWTGTVHLTAGEYKFRCNDDWAVSIGGAANDLQFVNDNVMFDGEEGDYEVTLNLNMLPYSCTLVKK